MRALRKTWLYKRGCANVVNTLLVFLARKAFDLRPPPPPPPRSASRVFGLTHLVDHPEKLTDTLLTRLNCPDHLSSPRVASRRVVRHPSFDPEKIRPATERVIQQRERERETTVSRIFLLFFFCLFFPRGSNARVVANP